MSRFPPDDSVLTTVRITRTAYAQLVGQSFYPPKPFGRWQEPQGSVEWRRRDVGMKIVRCLYDESQAVADCLHQACGFEMLYQESKGRSEFTTSGISASASSVRTTAPPLLSLHSPEPPTHR